MRSLETRGDSREETRERGFCPNAEGFGPEKEASRGLKPKAQSGLIDGFSRFTG